MGTFRSAIQGAIKGAVNSYQRFPAAMISATALALLTSVRIADNTIFPSVQFDKWQMMLGLSAIISLAWAAFIKVRTDSDGFRLSSLLSLVLIVPMIFLIRTTNDRIDQLTGMRMLAAAVISLIAFILIISYQNPATDFNKRFFMVHKALVIALLYMLVIMGGTNLTAAAVEILLYSDLPTDVYQHLTTWSAFLGFAFFLGNLPLLHRSADSELTESAQKQPRFIEVLFVFVMVPIMLVLSVVLLLWALRMLLTRQWPPFGQLASILSGYVLIGVWLNIMIAGSAHGLARFFRRFYPLVAIVFLAVDAFAIIRQIDAAGVQSGEYAAVLFWVFGLFAALVFLIRPVRRNQLTAWAAALLVLISVLPLAGYSDVTINSQISRLKSVLVKYDMLADDRIIAATAGNRPTAEDQLLITNAVSYLFQMDRRSELPVWLGQDAATYSRFADVFGFEQRWNLDEPFTPEKRIVWITREPGAVDISGYSYAILEDVEKFDMTTVLETAKGKYEIKQENIRGYQTGDPQVVISRDGQTLIEAELSDLLSQLEQTAGSSEGRYSLVLPLEQMRYQTESDSLKLMIVLQAVDISWESDPVNYNIIIDGIYIAEK